MAYSPTRFARAGIGLGNSGRLRQRFHCGFRCIDSRTSHAKGHMSLAVETFLGYDRFGFIQRSLVQTDTFDVGWDTANYALADVSLDAFTLSGSGTVGSLASITGTGAFTLDAFTASGTGKAIVTGTSSTSLSAFTTSATGNVTVSGTASATLGAFTTSATGKVIITGTGAATLDAFTGSGSGDLIASGTGTATLGAFTVAGTGEVINPPITGTLSVTLSDFTAYGIGGAPTADAFTSLAFQNDAFQLSVVDAVYQSNAFQSDTFPTLGDDPDVLQAASASAGAFSTSGSFTVAFAPSAALAGTGSLLATATVDTPAFSGFVQQDAFQSSGITTPTSYDRSGEASGAFTVTGDFVTTFIRSATLSGTGFLTQLQDTSLPFPRTELIGYADITANAGRIGSGTNGRLDADGVVTATARLIHNRSAALGGAGTLWTIGGLQQLPASATLSGSSTLASDRQKVVSAGAAIVLSGAGMTAAAAMNGAIFAGLQTSGRGTVAATAFARRFASQNASGGGTLTAGAIAIRATSATLSGSGGFSLTAKKTNRASYPAALLIGV